MNVLEVSGLNKYYGDSVALDNAGISVGAGVIHAIVGENGAGKSTMVKVLSGMVTPDSGEVKIDGTVLELGVPKVSRSAGVFTAFQELSLLPNLTVAENLLIAELPTRAGVVSRRAVQGQAAKILKEWGVDDLDPGLMVGQLPLSAKQRLELVRTLSHNPKILILDEPTAALPDTDWLFRHVRAARDRGACVLYISHKLAEIGQLCESGTIMRNGKIVGDFNPTNFSHDEIISSMIGRSISMAFPPRVTAIPADAPILLKAIDFEVGNRVRGVDLQVCEGEIVGVAGLEGQGQRELFYGLAGASPVTGGIVEVAGTATKVSNPRKALKAGPGIALVPEERKREGIFADLTSVTNISVPALKKLSFAGIIRRGPERKLAMEAGRDAHMPEEYLGRDVGRLSGGNQQKSVLARTNLTGAKILLMFDPTRGIDPSAKLEVYSTLRTSAANGAAVLFYSTEIPELVGLCDRVIVMYHGRAVAEFEGERITEEAIMQAAVGNTSSATAAQGDKS